MRTAPDGRKSPIGKGRGDNPDGRAGDLDGAKSRIGMAYGACPIKPFSLLPRHMAQAERAEPGALARGACLGVRLTA